MGALAASALVLVVAHQPVLVDADEAPARGVDDPHVDHEAVARVAEHQRLGELGVERVAVEDPAQVDPVLVAAGVPAVGDPRVAEQAEDRGVGVALERHLGVCDQLGGVGHLLGGPLLGELVCRRVDVVGEVVVVVLPPVGGSSAAAVLCGTTSPPSTTMITTAAPKVPRCRTTSRRATIAAAPKPTRPRPSQTSGQASDPVRGSPPPPLAAAGDVCVVVVVPPEPAGAVVVVGCSGGSWK